MNRVNGFYQKKKKVKETITHIFIFKFTGVTCQNLGEESLEKA